MSEPRDSVGGGGETAGTQDHQIDHPLCQTTGEEHHQGSGKCVREGVRRRGQRGLEWKKGNTELRTSNYMRSFLVSVYFTTFVQNTLDYELDYKKEQFG